MSKMEAIYNIIKSALEELTPEQMKALTMEPFEDLTQPWQVC